MTNINIPTNSINSYAKRYTNYINGRRHNSSRLDVLDGVSPIDGKTFYEIPLSKKTEVDVAVSCATKAFKKWSSYSCNIKASYLHRIAQVIEENLDVLSYAEVYDTGKNPVQARGEIQLAANYFKYFASCIISQEGSAAHVEDTLSINLYEPLGEICIILPWNYPLLMFSWKVAPAIAAGNTVVVKPSEIASLSILVLMEKLERIVPPGVINIILGTGEITGTELLKNQGVKKISFTGSLETGKKIMMAAANNVIPVILELGGKSPCIVTADLLNRNEDYLDSIVKGILHFTYNQGQTCGNLSRLLLHQSIADQVLEKVKVKLTKYSVGSPLQPGNNMGPVISDQQYRSIQNDLALASSQGAEVISFNQSLNVTKDCRTGFYMPPFLVESQSDMTIFQKEIFGPVLCYSKFNDLDQAINIANNSVYGLTAAIWSRDIKEINYLLKRVRTGKIWVNNVGLYYPHTKFGGIKQSGFGNEMHKLALNDYQIVKNIMQNY